VATARQPRTADIVLAADRVIAALRDDTPAVLDVARFLPTAKTERRCCQLRNYQ
jgi:hypothetical protein